MDDHCLELHLDVIFEESTADPDNMHPEVYYNSSEEFTDEEYSLDMDSSYYTNTNGFHVQKSAFMCKDDYT